ALSLGPSTRGFSPSRIAVHLFLIELSSTRLSRIDCATARIHLSASHHSRLRMDGQYASAASGLQFNYFSYCRTRGSRRAWWRRIPSPYALELSKSSVSS